MSPTEDCVNNQRCLLWAYKGYEVSEDGTEVTINSPQTLDAINLLVDLYNDGCIPPAAVSWDGSGNNTAYLTGQAAMVINMPTLSNALNEDGLEEIKENTKMAVLPAGPDGTKVQYGGAAFSCISAETKNPELVMDMVKYVYEGDWYESWLAQTAPVYMPALVEVAESEFWTTGDNGLTAQVASYMHFPGWPGPLTAEYATYDAQRMWGSMLQRILVDGLEPQAALDELEANMKEIIEK